MLGNQGKLLFLIGFTVTLLSVHFFSQKSINVLDYQGSIASPEKYQDTNAIAIPFPSNAERPSFLCQIPERGQHEFCTFTFHLGDSATQGIDISDFSEMSVDIDMTRNGWPVQNLPIRLYLQTYDPRLPKHWQYKTHQIDLDTYQYRKGLTLPLNYIQVADWWRKNSQADIKNSVVDLTNIVKLSILTPEDAPEGVYQIRVNAIRFTGHAISNSILLSSLTLAWLVLFLFHIFKLVAHSSAQQKLLREKLIRLSERSDALQQQAMHDPLTQALNRNGGLEKIQHLKLNLSNFCLMYLDLDHFKQLNDQYGHHIGDQVLQEFSAIVQGRLQTQGTLIRWGGEEFLAIVECKDTEPAHFLARKIRKDLAQHDWPNQSTVTCSIGIAQCDIHHSFQSSLINADSALYHAKNSGRDRIEVFIDHSLPSPSVQQHAT
ncbi:diguanylate cyclase (GGDEF) domain-containing protein [Vibrio xiamenensis]|uniref:diguanylate cyclase n=1 Tax=Vibrio xiamenensis TaxID=861298 RepID=A0A1G7X9N2_9VIBR|nr:GGDEF domain-containing protein [Vibrio xiamenensis]SDG80824.1 diguanylate cyclase (GGDEF) domain-containing protein [Vibrio xiamenensis]